MSNYVSPDGLRALIVLLLAVGQALMAYWPELRRWPETIPTRSARFTTPVVPVGWAFAIWGLIFLACLGFSVWHALPAHLDDPLLRTLGWLAAAVFAINIAWEYHVPTRDIDETSVVLIVLALVVLLAALWRLDGAAMAGIERWLVRAPFELFAGWISAATFVNLSSALRRRGLVVGTGASLALIAGALLLSGAVAALSGSLIYALVTAWALFGIAVANRGADGNATVGRIAALLMPAAPLLAVAA
jgi:hypothetical protein